MTQPEIEPRSPGPLPNTLPLGQWASKKKNEVLVFHYWDVKMAKREK